MSDVCKSCEICRLPMLWDILQFIFKMYSDLVCIIAKRYPRIVQNWIIMESCGIALKLSSELEWQQRRLGTSTIREEVPRAKKEIIFGKNI